MLFRSRDADFPIVESEDGGVFAFVSEDRLFCYNSNNNRFSLLFGFYAAEHEDERTFYDQVDIKILNIDEMGNVQFMVYGYMNRGIHEGTMGITVYFYNSILNTIEEVVYIPYEKSFSLLSSNIEQLTYLNNNNELFLYIGNSIFCVNLESKSYEIIVDNLEQGALKVSKSNRMIVWPSNHDSNRSDTLQLMNLNTKTLTEVGTDHTNYIRPLGFMEEDLVYGLAQKNDVITDNAGNTIVPMFRVNIQNQTDQAIKKSYQREGIYILDVAIEDNQITLIRARKNENEFGFHLIDDDQIISNETKITGENKIELVATESLKKITQIAAKSNIATQSLKFMMPKEVMYEGGHEVILEYPKKQMETFYVYDSKGIVQVFSNVANAINHAVDIAGNVMNELGQYIWIRGNRSISNQIMKIKEKAIDDENTSLADRKSVV